MNSKRKLLISMLAIVFVLLAVVATVAIAFALTQQTITTTLNIGYVVEDIDGTASATYTIGGVTESLTAMKGDNVIGDTLVFHAGDTEDAGNLMFPEGQIPLSAQNDNIVIQYTYSNTGERHYIASMSFDGNISADNMKVEYSIDGVTYSENRYAVVVPANTANKSYWIKISIENKAKSASFTGDFKWLLSGCDEQEDSYLSLTSVEFQQANDWEGNPMVGGYSASIANSGSYVGELVFPSSVNGDPVTTIIGKAPWDEGGLTQEQKNQVTSVYVPDSVETIGDYAFYNYQNLQTVTFEQNETAGASVQGGTGLTSIGSLAFSGCTGLTSIELPASLTSIEMEAFSGCTGLTNIELPSSVTSIRMCVFYACSGLTSIELPSSVTSIEYEAFSGCKGLTSIVIGNSVTTIENGAFSGCTGLTSITVASGNSKYHSAGNCLIETSSKTLAIGCKTSVIPTDGSVTSIGDRAFYECDGLTSIELPSSVTSIGGSAFYGCTGLTSIELPSSLTNIGSYALSGCKGLTKLTVAGGNTKYHSAGNCLIETSSKTLAIGCKTSVIPADGSVTSIGLYAFSGCTGLTSIELPSSLTSIGASAFTGCTGLTSIELPSSLTSIGAHSFRGCTGLTSIEVSANVTSIGGSAFKGCTGLTSVVIGNSVTTIGDNAFSGCTGLTSIVIPASVNSIKCQAFLNTGLTSAIFENKTGWKYGSTTITESQLSDPAKAAALLNEDPNKSAYYNLVRS